MTGQPKPRGVFFSNNHYLFVAFIPAVLGILLLLMLLLVESPEMMNFKGSTAKTVFWILTLSAVVSSLIAGLRLQRSGVASFSYWMKKCFVNFLVTAFTVLFAIVLLIILYNTRPGEMLLAHLDMLIFIPVTGAVCALVTTLLLRKADD